MAADFFLTIQDPIFLKTMAFTFKQAAVSALVSIFLGLLAAPALIWKGRGSALLTGILFFPNMMSSLVVILSLLILWPGYPFGFTGIIIAHVYLNMGLCAIWIASEMQEIDNHWYPVAQTFQASPYYYFRRILLPLLVPRLLSLFAIVFSFCFFSFVIPLILGGGPQGSTLEVLIYERIKVDADIKGAYIIGFAEVIIHIVFLSVIFVTLKTESMFSKRQTFFISPFAQKSRLFLGTMILVTVLPFLNLIRSVDSLSSKVPSLFMDLMFRHAFGNSLGIALCVCILLWGTFLLMARYGVPKGLFSMPSISSVLLGLILYLCFFQVGLDEQPVFIAAAVIGHFLILVIPLSKLAGPTLNRFHFTYIPVVTLWRPSPGFVFKSIIIPLTKGISISVAVLGFCWSLGEFAVTAMLSPSPQATLPLFIQSEMAGYRLDEALAASLVLIFTGVVAVYLQEGVRDGDR